MKKPKYPSRNIRSSAARNIQNAATEKVFIAYATEKCLYDMGASKIII